MSADPIEAKGRYVCPVCPARFESVGEKKQHVRAEHARPSHG